MNTKYLTNTVIGAIIIGGLSFWGGMHYANHIRAQGFSARTGMMNTGARQRGGMFGMGNGAMGAIIAKDQNGITLKLQDGGSKIVLISASTTISHITPASVADLTVGESVAVTGTTNSDGSISAQVVRLGASMQRAPGQ